MYFIDGIKFRVEVHECACEDTMTLHPKSDAPKDLIISSRDTTRLRNIRDTPGVFYAEYADNTWLIVLNKGTTWVDDIEDKVIEIFGYSYLERFYERNHIYKLPNPMVPDRFAYNDKKTERRSILAPLRDIDKRLPYEDDTLRRQIDRGYIPRDADDPHL